MDNHDRVLENYYKTTKNISDLIKYIGLGLVALVYAIFTSSSDQFVNLVSIWKSELIVVGLTGVVAVALDYLHNVINVIVIREAMNNNYEYNKKSGLYKFAHCLFYLKQGVALIGFVLFFVVFLISLK